MFCCNVFVHVSTSIAAGMQAFYEVRSCGSETNATAMPGVVRNYYLAAERVEWNYAPSEKDLINNNVSLTEVGRWADMSNIQERIAYCNRVGHCQIMGETLFSPKYSCILQHTMSWKHMISCQLSPSY